MFNRRWPRLTREEIVRAAKLLVIDDSDFDYLELFKNEGYSIDKWDDVPNLQRLETPEFHVILLDLKGVGRAFSAAEGAGIIEHIRERNPAQMVIAYTSARHNFEYQSFIDKADYRMPKSADFAVFKRTVDECLERRFCDDFYFERIREVLSSAGYATPDLRRKAHKAIWKRDVRPLQAALRRASVDAQTIDRVLTICSIATNVLVLIKPL